MKTAIRTVRRFLDLVLLALVVVILATVLAVNVDPGLGHQLVVIRGGSMEPAVSFGSTVDVVSAPIAKLHPGDVVTIKASNGVLVTHRIVDIAQLQDGYWLRLKGDANPIADPALYPASSIVGRVDATVPFVGFLIFVLTIPSGIAAIFLVASTLLLSIWLLEDLEEEEADETDEMPEAGVIAGAAQSRRGVLLARLRLPSPAMRLRRRRKEPTVIGPLEAGE